MSQPPHKPRHIPPPWCYVCQCTCLPGKAMPMPMHTYTCTHTHSVYLCPHRTILPYIALLRHHTRLWPAPRATTRPAIPNSYVTPLRRCVGVCLLSGTKREDRRRLGRCLHTQNSPVQVWHNVTPGVPWVEQSEAAGAEYIVDSSIQCVGRGWHWLRSVQWVTGSLPLWVTAVLYIFS